MSFYVYMLQVVDGSLYTGQTKDIHKRLKLHENGKGSKYVRSRLPFQLVFVEEFQTRSEAMKREIIIKKLSRKQKMRLIKNSTLDPGEYYH